MTIVPSYQDIEAAATRLKGIATRTPLVTNQLLDEITGAKIFLKPENLQRTGSFKFRGAYNAISLLDEDELKNGVVACSSGNHAQGIALAAKLLGTRATIVMPQDSPQIKLERTRHYGARIVTYDRKTGDRDEIANALCKENNAQYIHPYNHPWVIAGQGTVGDEIWSQMSHIKQEPDRVLVCTGGGGLTAGLSLALTHHYASINIHSVEPKGFDDYRRSLEAEKRVQNLTKSGSICDALLTDMPGEIGFEINIERLSQGFCVSDAQALQAVKFAFHELKMVVEPGGAVALAALLEGGNKWSGETICCILSGGNIDGQMIAKALA